jgi:hypothetical protein
LWDALRRVELAETLNFKQRNKGRFKTFISGNINGTTKNLTDLERFYIAVQADGYVSDRYTGDLCGTIPVWFGLAKERKCTRLKLLCDSLGFEMIELTGRKENGNVKAQRKFKVNVPLEYCLDFKNFYWVNLKDKDSNWCKEFILEITKWDGSVIKGLPHMSTTNKDVAEKIQAIGFLAGYQTHYRINVDNRSEKFSDCHIIRFNPVKYLLCYIFVCGGHMREPFYHRTIPFSYFQNKFLTPIRVLIFKINPIEIFKIQTILQRHINFKFSLCFYIAIFFSTC